MQLQQSFGKLRSWVFVLVVASGMAWSAKAQPIFQSCTNLTAECTGGLTPVTFHVTAVDGSGNPLPVTCIPTNGLFRLGVSNVVCSAVDSLGRSNSCTFTVTVVDTTPPRVTCNTNITIN